MSDYEGAVKPSSIEKEVYNGNLGAYKFTEAPSGIKMRLDYGARIDGQPDYQGFAPTGLATNTDGWVIYKFAYDGSGNQTQRDIAGIEEDVNWDARITGGYTYD